jgi:hypothetical protein
LLLALTDENWWEPIENSSSRTCIRATATSTYNYTTNDAIRLSIFFKPFGIIIVFDSFLFPFLLESLVSLGHTRSLIHITFWLVHCFLCFWHKTWLICMCVCYVYSYTNDFHHLLMILLDSSPGHYTTLLFLSSSSFLNLDGGIKKSHHNTPFSLHLVPSFSLSRTTNTNTHWELTVCWWWVSV